MAVVVKYVVVRNGKEVMTFATKKEADAHDRQLDIAEQLYEFLQTAELDIVDKTLDELTFFMAKHRDALIPLLKGSKPKDAEVPASRPKPAETSANKARKTKAGGAKAAA